MNDHRDLIALYDLGHIEEHSPGLIHWHANGIRVINRLEQYIRQLHVENNYDEVRSPIILSKSLWEQSGHWNKYKDLMFISDDGEHPYAIKPMSCPGHISIYKQKKRSYRELPYRQFEFGHVHRKEMSGSLSGWLRLRGFVQDDSHVICSKNDISSVIQQFVFMVEKAYKHFGFNHWEWHLSLRPNKRSGDESIWDLAESSLKKACSELNIPIIEKPGDGAFYGPKLEAILIDRLGRKWQCGVAQLDFVLPEKFSLSYHGNDGKEHVPVMIHHAILGSLERWLAIVMEHDGKLPDWLSPHEIAILPVSESSYHYACEIYKKALRKGKNAFIFSEGPLSGRIREVNKNKFVSNIVIGPKESEEKMLSINNGNVKNQQIHFNDWLL